MLVVHVHVQVKPDCVESFKALTLANASASLREPGVARFDVIQDTEDPTAFVLVEAYKSAEAPSQHKQTEHYQLWRDGVVEMMAKPRTSRKFHSVFPSEARWLTPD